MSDDDLEWRLHAMLTGRAEQIDSALTGAELRRHAEPVEHRGRAHVTRRAAAMLAAAAAVVALAVTAAEVSGDGTPHRPTGPIPGGGVSAPSRTDPPPTRSPSSRATSGRAPSDAPASSAPPTTSVTSSPTMIFLPSGGEGPSSGVRRVPSVSVPVLPQDVTVGPGGTVVSAVPPRSTGARPTR